MFFLIQKETIGLSFVLFSTIIVMCLSQIYPQGYQIGFQIDPVNAYKTLFTKSACICRQLCREDQPKCKIYSSIPNGDARRCSLFDGGTELKRISSNTSMVGASLLFNGKAGKLHVDGLYYYLPQVCATNFAEAKTICESQGGFRLAMLKTEKSFEVAKEYETLKIPNCGYLVVDVRKDATGEIVHGDGTRFNETELGINIPSAAVANDLAAFDIFVVAYGNIHDEDPNQRMVPLCQANPLGFETDVF